MLKSNIRLTKEEKIHFKTLLHSLDAIKKNADRRYGLKQVNELQLELAILTWRAERLQDAITERNEVSDL